MDFPNTNKISKAIGDKFGENAKVLEEYLKSIDVPYFIKAYWIAYVMFLLSLFLLIVTVRGAMVIF